MKEQPAPEQQHGLARLPQRATSAHQMSEPPLPLWRQVDRPPQRLRRRVLQSSLVLGLLLIGWLNWRASAAPSPTAQTARTPILTSTPFPGGGSASNTPDRPARPTESAAPPTTRQLPAPTAADVAAQFLAAYFTWEAAESDATYVSSWQGWAEADALALLIKNSPRLLLDQGADSAANNRAFQVPPGVLSQALGQAQLDVTWTMQVLPAGGEMAAWQVRQLQASVALVQAGGVGWQVAGLTWTSRSAGGL